MKDLKKISTRLPARVIAKLKIHCAIREIPMGVVIGMAIDKYIVDYEKLIAEYRSKHG